MKTRGGGDTPEKGTVVGQKDATKCLTPSPPNFNIGAGEANWLPFFSGSGPVGRGQLSISKSGVGGDRHGGDLSCFFLLVCFFGFPCVSPSCCIILTYIRRKTRGFRGPSRCEVTFFTDRWRGLRLFRRCLTSGVFRWLFGGCSGHLCASGLRTEEHRQGAPLLEKNL